LTVAAEVEREWETARAKVSRSSFYVAMRLMPEERREAMFAIYAFNRAVDDIADEGDLSAGERVERLNDWRAAIDAIYCGSGRPAKLAAVALRFRLRREDFLAVIDGVTMDATGASFAPDQVKLDLYCDRVASAVGRLSIKIFGMDEEPGFRLAHHLGRALQFTNILRDLAEDAAMGRLYLPREILADAGITSSNPTAVLSHHCIDRACHNFAQLAHEHYRAADTVLRSGARGSLSAPRLMSAVYRRLLTKMEKSGWDAPQRRVHMGRGPLLLIALRQGLSW
jgi:phytoene synthase